MAARSPSLSITGSNPIEAVRFLYAIPISLLASERGWPGGLYAAAGAIGLTIVWAVVQHVPLGVIGYCSRSATFASVGILLGFHAEQRRKLEQERERLLQELRRGMRGIRRVMVVLKTLVH